MSKMIKCDICGREIDGSMKIKRSNDNDNWYSHMISIIGYDTCNKCNHEIRNFIRDMQKLNNKNINIEPLPILAFEEEFVKGE